MRYTTQATASLARIIDVTRAEAAAYLRAWIPGALSRQHPEPGDSGLLPYRGPRPWRVTMLVADDKSAVVEVVETQDTVIWRERRERGPGGRRHGLSPEGASPVLRVRVDTAMAERIAAIAETREVSMSDLIREALAEKFPST